MTNIVFLVAFSLVYLANSASSEMTSDQMKYFYKTVLNPGSYDKRIRPNQTLAPVTVKVSLYVLRLSDWNQESKDLKISLYFRQMWQDDRLSHNGDGPMIGGDELSNMIWKPDTFFSDSSEGSMSQQTVPNTFVQISTDGNVFISAKYTIKHHCRHRVIAFPMDSLICKLAVESYGYSTGDIRYTWQEKGNGIQEGISIPGFSLDSKYQNETALTVISTGNYSTISFTIQMTRTSLPYLIKYFVPLIITTILCMIPAGDPETKSKVTLISFAMTSILVITLSVHVSPRGCYVTAFDAFGFICLLFTTAVLLMDVRKGTHKEGSLNKISAKEEKVEKHLKRAIAIAFASFLLIFLLVLVALK